MFNSGRQQKLLEVFSHINHVVPLEPTTQRRSGGLSKRNAFCLFNPSHMAEAKEFYDLLMGAKDFDDFIEIAVTQRRYLNDGLFVYAFSRAAQDYPHTTDLLLPPIHEIVPDKFVPSDTINRAVKLYLDYNYEDPSSNSVRPTSLKVVMDTTGSPRNEEHKMAYFREDIGLNSHHWHWHLVYPSNGESKDRKGELFYYSHQQLCARYDCERLSVGLRPAEALHSLGEVLTGYSPHLTDLSTGKSRGSRPDGMFIEETDNFELWLSRIRKAIHQGYLVDTEGNRIPLDTESGIDWLGAVVEPSQDSKNPDHYGNLHNGLHDAIANIHDPTGKFQEEIGVIGDNSTALRDPAFYNLHRFVDNLFTEYKLTLPPYTPQELNFPGIEIKEVIIEGKESNVILTSMKKATMQLNHAIRMKIPVEVEYEHLDHDPFVYKIKVNNRTNINQNATVRIFMAPRSDGSRKCFPLNTQRRYFIEMDKFFVKLAPGENAITQKSTESSVTLMYNPSFQNLKEMTHVSDEQLKLITDSNCSCGWPHHLLVPRGTDKGMDFKLFVMLTDYNSDFVRNFDDKCTRGAVSYCGAKDSKYPDKRPMGFPFDRIIKEREFKRCNMSFTDIKIKFKGGNAE